MFSRTVVAPFLSGFAIAIILSCKIKNHHDRLELLELYCGFIQAHTAPDQIHDFGLHQPKIMNLIASKMLKQHGIK
jgi:hypothetical protein